MSEEYNDLTPYILNECNQLITTDYIESVLKKYGDIIIKVKNLKIFQNAMTHISYLKRDSEYYKAKKIKRTNNKEMRPIKNPQNCIQLQDKSYERLEFLGDSVIHLIIANYLFDRYESQHEGFITKLRTKLERTETLAQLAECIGLDEYILISRYIEVNNGRKRNRNILEDSFEALMGALYKEAGYDPCNIFFKTLMEKEVDFAHLLYTETNFKAKLLEYFHKQGWEDPKYDHTDVSGPGHKKQFLMCVVCKKDPRDNGEIVGHGSGASKKKR